MQRSRKDKRAWSSSFPYRLQGGSLLIEYDNTQRDVNHVHTVWRDLSMDFGGDPLAQHDVDHH